MPHVCWNSLAVGFVIGAAVGQAKPALQNELFGHSPYYKVLRAKFDLWRHQSAWMELTWLYSAVAWACEPDTLPILATIGTATFGMVRRRRAITA